MSKAPIPGPPRDVVGYNGKPPKVAWPGGARIAISLVVNYEEGSEPSMQDGEGFTENGLTDAQGRDQGVEGRDLAAEGLFEYGSRVGFWRLMRLFRERSLPLTVFGCGLALERHPLPWRMTKRSLVRPSGSAAAANCSAARASPARVSGGGGDEKHCAAPMPRRSASRPNNEA